MVKGLRLHVQGLGFESTRQTQSKVRPMLSLIFDKWFTKIDVRANF